MEKSIKQMNKGNIILAVVSIVIFNCFLSMYNFDNRFRWFSLVIIIEVVLLKLFYSNQTSQEKSNGEVKSKNLQTSTYVIIFLAIVIIVIMAHRYVLGGVKLLANQILQVYGEQAGTHYHQMFVDLVENEYSIARSIIMLMIASIIGYAGYQVEESNSYKLFVLLLGGIVIPGFFNITPNKVDGILLIISMIVFFNRQVHTLVIFLVTGTIILSISYLGTINSQGIVFDWNKQMLTKWNEYRYDSGQEGMLPEGDLTKVIPLNLSNKVALEIVMSKPNSYYLRGFVGSVYDNSKWTDLDNYDYYHKYDLFYWFHQDEFYPLDQLSTVSDLIDEQQQVNVKVNLKYASKLYQYTPYEMIGESDTMKDTIMKADTNIRTNKIFGNKVYEFHAIPSTIKTYPLLQKQYTTLIEDSANPISYAVNERNYKDFAIEQYTQLNADIQALLTKELGESLQDGKALTCSQATKKIQKYLDDHIIYDVNISGELDGHDAMEYLVKYSGRGYSIHYATLATLMFRYYGIPARYVEGYLITPNDIKYAKNYQAIAIRGYNAHAWVEVYQDGIGWVPVEMTPAYQDVMEQPIALGISGVQKHSGSSNNNQNEEMTPPEEEIEDNLIQLKKDDKEVSIKMVFLILCSVVLMLSIIAILTYQIHKKIAIRRSFTLPNRKEAVQNIFPAIMRKLYSKGIKKIGGSLYDYKAEIERVYTIESANRYIKVVDIVQKATFSEEKIEEEEYCIVMSFMNELIHNKV